MESTSKAKSLLIVLLFLINPILIFAGDSDPKSIVLTIVKKDNLVNICNAYLENPNEWKFVAKFNELENPDLIYPGQTLRIPAKLLKGIPMKGTVTFLKGQVTALMPRNEDWVELKKSDIVIQGTKIRTGKDSAAEITFEDGSCFFLKPETYLDITTARKRDPYYMVRELFVPVGRTLMKIKKSTGQDSRFEIHTPSAISAARGTRFRVSVDTDNITRTEVLEGVVGVKGQGREVLLDQGRGTYVKKGHRPNAPARLLFPPRTTNLKPLYQTLPVQFNLSPVKNAVAYRIAVANDQEFKNVVHEAVVKKDNPLAQFTLSDDIYYLRTLSIDGAGLEGLPSKPGKFEVRTNPLPPFIQTPEDGREFKTDRVVLEWLNVPDAVSYEVHVSKNMEFAPLFKAFKDIKSSRQTLKLAGYGDYYFMVRSIAGDNFKGLWSDVVKFTFVKPPPAPPVDEPGMDESSIRLRWQDLGPGMTYHFQMAKNPEFEKILLDKNTAQAEIRFNKPEDSGTYFVRVSALDPDGYEGEFTAPQSFKIENSFYEKAGVVFTLVLGVLIIVL
ncbi:MAG: FecR domain-containing protein [Desulfobacter sp.]|nr:FecR domain-containing protein [Desulfobacter sp.]